MRILLTNDDGIFAPGLCALYEALRGGHEIHVIAPDSERSAVGHAITIADPLRAKSIKREGLHFGWAISGTPADCVKLGIHELVDGPVDLVVSGINPGANVGINCLYSGTVSAATEAAILGIRSIAVSINDFRDPDYCFAAYFAGKMVEWIRQEGDKLIGQALNINIPAIPANLISGVKVTKQGTCRFIERFDKRVDPRGNVYYWQAGEGLSVCRDEDVDSVWLEKGYITVTPLKFDLTNYDVIRHLNPPGI